MKQTALQWLEQEFIKLEATTGVHGVMYELIEKAKEMEKEQIKKAYLDGVFDRTIYTTNNNDLVPYHTLCGCNPANGGNGVCGCVMGNKMVDKRVDYGTNYWTTYTTNTTY